MHNSNDLYSNNPLIHKIRTRSPQDSRWVGQFDCSDMRPLIICRGPIRKEVMDVFEQMGIDQYGILLSEKDSITYINALAPELRQLTDPSRVHRVPDYTGADKEERTTRINQIIQIAKDNGYGYIFAGYGFMAEDEELVKAIEAAGLTFMGPCSQTVRGAGSKDQAKRTALACGVSVTPGLDNLTALTLLRKAPDVKALQLIVDKNDLAVEKGALAGDDLEQMADVVLDASYEKGVDIISVEELCAEAEIRVSETFMKYPENRMRLKAIGGGGGKGQRILAAPSSYDFAKAEDRCKAAAAKAPELVIEIINEVKTNGVGDNKNVLIELNIETTRHQEIQVIGNGVWTLSMGARDCSLQMHEQKLLEISQTQESLKAKIDSARAAGEVEVAVALETDLDILVKMEVEAERFGEAVGLDSVSTFECIVDKAMHFFMEMNTRIQVEHRVTEMCYALKFENPDDDQDYFVVDSLVEAMTLLAKFKKDLPKPTRIPRYNASVEARLNATNSALRPHAGGLIEYWSDPIEGEIRDDQGISMKNPDSGRFMTYHLAGAYDSNIALLLTVGEARKESYDNLAEALRRTRLQGENLATNLFFHYGLVHWLMSEHVHAKATTAFVVPYLTIAGLLKQKSNDLDLSVAYKQLKLNYKKSYAETMRGSDELDTALTAVDAALERKHSLLLRPLEALLKEPHLLSGWLSLNKSTMKSSGPSTEVQWLVNPIEVLAETYHFLNMDYRDDLPAAYCIWKHDHELLQKALRFYEVAEVRFGESDYVQLNKLLTADKAPKGIDAKEWEAIRAAHAGYQTGAEILGLLPLLAKQTCFYDLKVNSDLTITIPDKLTDEALQDAMAKVLVPPPVTKADEIVAACGGMFYSREAPGMEPFVKEGDHFDVGDPIYIIEVMKMFNKIPATFSGTIDKVLMESADGTIVKEGEPLFKITPDEKMVELDPEAEEKRISEYTTRLVDSL